MMIDQSETSSQSFNSENPPVVYKIKQYPPANLLQTLSFMLIRPPRFLYNQQLLIPPQKYKDIFHYEQFKIPFKLSLYKTKEMRYVILYLHGNSSSRFQGYMQLKQLPPGVGLACFDFNGCGMRFQSDYITLGKKQSQEVDIAAKFLKNMGYKVVGWGRSMGSVSLLLSNELDVMVADSPFSSLSDLCKQSSQKFVPSICCCLVRCFFPCVFCCVKSDVISKADFDPNQLQIAEAVRSNDKNKNKSLFIMAGREDMMIPVKHSEIIYECFPGKKKLSIFDGTHNSNRPQKIIKECLTFVEESLGLQPHKSLKYVQKKQVKRIRLKPLLTKQSEKEDKNDTREQQGKSIDKLFIKEADPNQVKVKQEIREEEL